MDDKYGTYQAALDENRAPHCDSLILHAPTECEICDTYSKNLQEIRESLGINFTGHYEKNKLICPAEMKRNLPKIELWHGNIPVK